MKLGVARCGGVLAPISVNWLAVAIAFVVSMAWGFLVYARPVLGNWWMDQVGLTPDAIKKEDAMRAVMISALVGLLMAVAYAIVFDWTGASGLVEGATVGFVLGLAFGVPIGMVHPVFEGRPVPVGLLYGAHHLVEFVVIGAIYGALG